MGASEDTLELLKSIDASLKKLVGLSTKQVATTGGSAIADDRDLDGPRGDETLRFTPRDWQGEPCKGKRMSECSPACLDLLASSFDYFAQKNDKEGNVDSKGKPKSTWDKLSAARCRGWAARIRSGWRPPAAAQVEDMTSAVDALDSFGSTGFGSGGDDIPF